MTWLTKLKWLSWHTFCWLWSSYLCAQSAPFLLVYVYVLAHLHDAWCHWNLRGQYKKITRTHLAKGESASLKTESDMRCQPPAWLEFPCPKFSLLQRRRSKVSTSTCIATTRFLVFTCELRVHALRAAAGLCCLTVGSHFPQFPYTTSLFPYSVFYSVVPYKIRIKPYAWRVWNRSIVI